MGKKVGEMEKDALISHGTARFLKERLYDMSDPYKMKVCNHCGGYTIIDNICKNCNSEEISMIIIPYCCKLLFQNLGALNLKIELIPKK